eukprot:CAMPEP_0119556120 /NCGR_PEP_ID=MMETSP1352-20130426/8162_1 /TAXON_ID=265584 /ORGANISM="Stauroneis constricta, Strain CCMP1120" /LENGTH=58 /DNA_ID=CAMNT_0007603021 /DNA_START=21 /DNA_END=194 /DNA_ORIENTATION=-
MSGIGASKSKEAASSLKAYMKQHDLMQDHISERAMAIKAILDLGTPINDDFIDQLLAD